MKTFREVVNESKETTAVPVGVIDVEEDTYKYVCILMSNEKNVPVEVFNQKGDFISLADGSLHKQIIDIWKKSDEVDWDEYVDSFGTPDWDADNVVINMNKTKLGKIERELDKLSFD